MPTLTIASLGEFQLWRDLVPISNDAWPTQKCKSLFKILLSARGQLVTADQLMEWLWPDLAPTKARNNLWVAVSQARRILEPDLPPRGASSFLISTDAGYRLALGEDVQWDVTAFLDASARAKAISSHASHEEHLAILEEARACYNGDYLVEDRYEEWALSLREELQRRYLQLLLELGECYAQVGRYEDSVTQARAVLVREVAAEPAYQALMRYAYYLGDQRTALQAYDACVRALRSELDATPLEATTELYRQIQRRTLPRPVAVVRSTVPKEAIYTLTNTPFVGRTAEYNALIQAIHAIQAGSGRVVLVQGEPGIGKSRLLQETLAYARYQNLLTLVTYCYQVEQAIPYQPVIDLLDQALNTVPANRFLALPPVYLAELATLSPELRELAPDLPSAADDMSARQARRLRALHQCLELLAGDQGLVLAVDDVHWADHATWQFIHHLASHSTTLPLLLICTYRAEELAANPELEAFVDSMVRTPQAMQLPLRRLSPDDTSIFLTQLTGSNRVTEYLSPWLHAETDGNPFFLVSILQGLVEQRLLSEDRPIWQVDDQRLDTSDTALTLPDALRESVRVRLRRLPQPMRRVLEAAAVLGRWFDFATLAAVSGEAGLALLEMVEALIQRQLLRETGDGEGYDFSHDKVREVVYSDLSSTRRILLHRAAAAALAEAGGTQRERSANLARHYELGQVWNQALYYLIDAADCSRDLFAVQEAAQFYDRAIDLTLRFPSLVEPGVVLDLYMRRGEVRALLGRQMQDAVDDLHRVLEAAQASGDPDRQRTVLIALGQVYRMADQLDAATKYLTAALELSRAQGDQYSLANVLHHLGTVAWSAGNNYHAARYHQEAMDLCRRLEVEDIIMIQALHGRGEAFIAAGRPVLAIRLFEESLLLAQRTGNKRYEGENLQMIGWSAIGLTGTAEYARACAMLEKSLEVSREAHMAWNSDITLAFLGWAVACQGEYRRGLALIHEAIDRLRADGLVRFLSMAYDFLGYIYQDLNLPDAAFDAHSAGLNIALTAQMGFWLPRLSANVAIDRLRLGDLSAVRDLEVTFAVAMDDYVRFHAVRALEGLMEAGILRGEAEHTLYYAQVLEKMCQVGGLAELHVQVHRWRGAAYRLLGQFEQAKLELEEAEHKAELITRPRLHWEIHAEFLALAICQDDLAQAALHQNAMTAIAQAIVDDLQDPSLSRGLLEAALPTPG